MTRQASLTFDGVFPTVDFERSARERVTQEWITQTVKAIDALQEWRRKLADWQRTGCDSGTFHAALLTLRSSGLEDWADRNSAGLDALAEAVICGRVG